MRYSAVALFAGAAMATSTVYSTDVVTITSCGPEVPDCPANSGSYPTQTGYPVESYPTAAETTSEALPTTESSAYPTGSYPVESSSYPASSRRDLCCHLRCLHS
ncbi:hypothetical protein NPX13_g10506 [Xylaria arbuscula]|uniref:Uncharacterized protein n=1 Tax=Xylaria arbuscula TaxID=114810 RepID=A0A9W8TGI7_9PEZI|nr:hypothetical protein NPX13_g10506 [Xylaria arbuscula]